MCLSAAVGWTRHCSSLGPSPIREDFRKTYQQENPSVKLMQEIGKACGEKWNTMAFEEKVKYYDIATEKRAEFEKAMIEYNKKKQSGELSEESDYD
ncbi:hypothetical protein PVAP13_5KG421128 [Panicum virgatum]|uniref:HMG box domain-containing protein n=2 Tax=Panicum virgatum TaxID=38727 RepID=A0A8T0SM51_PANVG|nr:hypothetical protein PVAP13_5KG421128 [Panicum virgatum]